jgi:hypothetical protein
VEEACIKAVDKYVGTPAGIVDFPNATSAPAPGALELVVNVWTGWVLLLLSPANGRLE